MYFSFVLTSPLFSTSNQFVIFIISNKSIHSRLCGQGNYKMIIYAKYIKGQTRKSTNELNVNKH